MQVKVCGLKERENLAEVIMHKPDFIGLIFFVDSERYIGTDKAMQLFIRSISTAYKVGVFVNAGYKQILDAIQDYGLNFVQLHGNESPDFCACISGHIPVIKSFGIDSDFDFASLVKYEQSCDYFLFDTATVGHGGSGQEFDHELLKKYNLSKSYFLSGGIGLENISRVMTLEDSRLKAVDVNSRLETAPGIKDVNKIKAIIHEIRN